MWKMFYCLLKVVQVHLQAFCSNIQIKNWNIYLQVMLVERTELLKHVVKNFMFMH